MSKDGSVALPSMSEEQVKSLLVSLGQPAFRAKQLLEWIWGKSAQSYDDMSNLPKVLRKQLAISAPLQFGTIADRQVSQDGTRKYLIEFPDGVSVETVGLPTEDRLTVCLSSQAGCAMGCTFCATGQGGFIRNLTAGEIADQVRIVAADFERRVSNVVVMGQGEPFANYDAVMAGLRIINAPWGANVGARHITVSTCGIIQGVKRFIDEPEQFTLAVSLHSAKQATRDKLMPGVKNQPLLPLKIALAQYYHQTHRRPSLEYALIAGVSDTDEELRSLAAFSREIHAHINLIPINPITDSTAKRPAEKRTREVVALLESFGAQVSVRTERGSDIAAACGQLKQLHQ